MVQRAVTVAGAALTAAGALAFARVFDSGDFVAVTLGAAVGPFLVGAIARRAHAGSIATAFASVAVGIMYVLVVVYGWTPFTEWLDATEVRNAFRDGWHAVRTEVPPVSATTGMLLLLVSATWACGTIVHQLLMRDATTGALVAPLALFLLATALGSDQGGLTVTLGFAIAALAFLLIQQQAITGRRRGRFVGRSTSGSTGLLVAGSLLGAIAVTAGVTIAPALPGSDADPLLDYRGLGSRAGEVYEPSIAPTLDVGARLQRGARTEVFRVRAAEPAYWRLMALDDYEGNWVLDAPEGSIDSGLDDSVVDPLVQRFEIGELGERWMPSAYEARRVTDTDVLVIRDSTTLLTEADSVSGLRYTVESELPVRANEVTPSMAAATAAPPPVEIARFSELPDDFSPAIAAQAAEATAGAATPFERARALRDFFRDPTFVYDPNVRYNAQGLEDSQAVIEAFLEQRQGFCVQYAGAYAVMARSLGIPTRMVVGFTPGARDGDEFVVTNHEAHAWPEVWLAGIGWTNMFDPTPPSSLPGGSDLPGESPPMGVPTEPPPPSPETPEPTPTTLAPPDEGLSEPPTVEVATGGDAGTAATPWWVVTLATLLAIALVLAMSVTGVLWRKHHRRARRRRGEPTAAVVGAWREAIERLHEARIPVSSTCTPHELSDAIARSNPVAGRALDELAGTFSAARYGRGARSETDVTRAWEQVVRFEAALESGLPLRTRWRRRLRVRARR